MPVEGSKSNSCPTFAAKERDHLRRRRVHNDDVAEGKYKRDNAGGTLPFLAKTINDMTNTEFSQLTQGIRLQMMQQTGSWTGLHDSTNSIRKNDMGGTLNAMLDTINSRAEENLYSYDANAKRPPWYLPSLNMHQLMQCCCRPNCSPLFGPYDEDGLSIICYCSEDSQRNTRKPATNEAPVRRRQSFHYAGGEICKEGEGVTKSCSSKARKGYRELTRLQCLALEQWCRTISDVTCRERLELDPTRLHDTVMKVVRRDEHTVQLVDQVQKHERMQEREYTRDVRRSEEEHIRTEIDALRGVAVPSDWRSLLTSWSKGTCGDKGFVGGASHGKQNRVTPSKVTNLLYLPSSSVGLTFGCKTSLSLPVGGPPGYLEGLSDVNVSPLSPKGKLKVHGKVKHLGADGHCIPLVELQRLLSAVKDGSLMSNVMASRREAGGSEPDAQLLYERSGKNTLFASPTSFYMTSNWLECIIRDDDLSAVRLITRKLQDHAMAKGSESPNGLSPFTLPKSLYGGFRASKYLHTSSGSNNTQTVLQSVVEGVQLPLELQRTALFLLPLRLFVADVNLPPRVVVTDAVTILNGAKDGGEGGLAVAKPSIPANVRKYYEDIQERDVGFSLGSSLPSSGLCEFLTGADVSGRAPCASEHLIAYYVDLQAIVKQSTWRATTSKQLANEEYDHLKRKVLAKVFVMLAMKNAMTELEKKGESVSYVTAEATKQEEVENGAPSLLSLSRTTRVAVHSLALPAMTSYPGSFDGPSLDFSLSDFVLPLTCAPAYTTQVDVYAAPAYRDHYVVDAKHLFCVAATALEESNNVILPALSRLATEYRLLCSRLTSMAEESACETSATRFTSFTMNDSARVSTHLSGALELLKLESDYSKLLTTLLRNECVIIYYNLHHLPHCRFTQQRKRLWGHLYLRTLRLAYAFCVLVQELGLLPIPPKYRPFLRPVLMLLDYHGGQEELRSRTKETLLELEMRANELGAMLCRKEVTTHYMPELDAAATVVAEGKYSVSRFISCLASPDDVLSPVLLPVDLPERLFSDVPSIAG